jgi:hypothetical protein
MRSDGESVRGSALTKLSGRVLSVNFHLSREVFSEFRCMS